MKRAIILRGSSDCGKTTLLTTFYDWIKFTFVIAITSYKVHSNGDFEVVFTYGKLKVSYFTQGDYGSEVDRFLKDSVSIGSDLIVCCCRTKGATFNAVKAKLIYPNFLIDFVQVHKVPSANIKSFLALKQDELKARIIGLLKP